MALRTEDPQRRGRGRAALCSSLLHDNTSDINDENISLVILTKQDDGDLVQLLVRLVVK